MEPLHTTSVRIHVDAPGVAAVSVEIPIAELDALIAEAEGGDPATYEGDAGHTLRVEPVDDEPVA